MAKPHPHARKAREGHLQALSTRPDSPGCRTLLMPSSPQTPTHQKRSSRSQVENEQHILRSGQSLGTPTIDNEDEDGRDDIHYGRQPDRTRAIEVDNKRGDPVADDHDPGCEEDLPSAHQLPTGQIAERLGVASWRQLSDPVVLPCGNRPSITLYVRLPKIVAGHGRLPTHRSAFSLRPMSTTHMAANTTIDAQKNPARPPDNSSMGDNNTIFCQVITTVLARPQTAFPWTNRRSSGVLGFLLSSSILFVSAAMPLLGLESSAGLVASTCPGRNHGRRFMIFKADFQQEKPGVGAKWRLEVEEDNEIMHQSDVNMMVRSMDRL